MGLPFYPSSAPSDPTLWGYAGTSVTLIFESPLQSVQGENLGRSLFLFRSIRRNVSSLFHFR
jgi:hypothetical protein